jgi:hypothetical protein
VQNSSKKSVIGLKARRTCALIVEPLPPPLDVKGLAPTPMIVVNGIGVCTTN